MGRIRVKTEVAGFAHLAGAFRAIGQSQSRSVVRKAMIQAYQPAAALARAVAPRGEEPVRRKRLAETIVVSERRRGDRRRGNANTRERVTLYLGPTDPKGHLVEFGHLLVRGKRLTKRRRYATGQRVIGHVPAHPFMRPAWDATKEQVLELFRVFTARELRRTAKNWARRAERGKLSKRAVKALTR